MDDVLDDLATDAVGDPVRVEWDKRILADALWFRGFPGSVLLVVGRLDERHAGDVVPVSTDPAPSVTSVRCSGSRAWWWRGQTS